MGQIESLAAWRAWQPDTARWREEFLARAGRGGWWYVALACIRLAADMPVPLALSIAVIAALALLAVLRWRARRIDAARWVVHAANAQALLFGGWAAWQIFSVPAPAPTAISLLFLAATAAAGAAALAIPPGRLGIWLACLLGLPFGAVLSGATGSHMVLAASIVAFAIYLLVLGRTTRDQLRRTWFAEDRLAQAGERKRELISHLSHDIKTPLSAVVGYLDLSLGSGGSAPDPLVRVARAQVVNSIELLHHLLHIAKTDVRHEESEMREFAPAPLFRTTCELYRGRLQQENRILEVECAVAEDFRCVGFELAMYRALCNCLSNAIRHVRTGTVHARLRTREMSLRRYMLEIDIEDAGPGLRDDVQAALDAVERGETTPRITSTADGDGLGLIGTAQGMRAIGGTLRSGTPPEGPHRMRLRLPMNPIGRETDATAQQGVPTVAPRDTRTPEPQA